MSGPEHYHVAELLLAEAREQPGEASARSMAAAQVQGIGRLVCGRQDGGERSFPGREGGWAPAGAAVGAGGCPLRVVPDEPAHPEQEIACLAHGQGGQQPLLGDDRVPPQVNPLPGRPHADHGIGCAMELRFGHRQAGEAVRSGGERAQGQFAEVSGDGRGLRHPLPPARGHVG
jgi:hypothetical protein